jgi:hypothetical protein
MMNINFVPSTPVTKPRSGTETTVAVSESVMESPLKSVDRVVLLDEDEREVYEPFGFQIVARDVPSSAFASFVERNAPAKGQRRKFLLLDGSLIVGNLYTASAAHESVLASIIGQVREQSRQCNNNRLLWECDGNYAIEYDTIRRLNANPDLQIKVFDSEIPSVVIEVIYSNGGVRAAQRYAEDYLTPTSNIEVFIAIQIMYPGNRMNRGEFRACAFVFRKSAPTPSIPVDMVSFGTMDMTAECLHHIRQVMRRQLIRGTAGQPLCTEEHNYFIEIPWNLFEVRNEGLVANIDWINADAGHNLRIDMFELQSTLIRSFRRMSDDDLPLPYGANIDHLISP